MSEKNSPNAHNQENKAAAQPQQPAAESSPATKSSFFPLALALLAVLIAVLALAVGLMRNKPAPLMPVQTLNERLDRIETRIGEIASQVNSDKQDIVNMRLKQILLSLDQLSHIADDATRERIERAYKLLQPLAGPAGRVQAEVDMQSVVADENQAARTRTNSREKHQPTKAAPRVEQSSPQTDANPRQPSANTPQPTVQPSSPPASIEKGI